MNKLRILQIVPSLLPGGAERMVVHLLASYNRDKFEMGIVSLYDPVFSDLEEIIRDLNVPVWHLGKQRGPDMRIIQRLRRVVDTFNPKVIHTHQYVLPYVLPMRFRRRTFSIVHTIHSVADKDGSKIVRCINGVAFRQGVVPVAIARTLIPGIKETYNIAKDIRLIRNGIPIRDLPDSNNRRLWRERHGFKDEAVLFICVARLGEPKNQGMILQAFYNNLKQDSRTHLLLVGEGEDREHLKRVAFSLGITERVHFLGFRKDVGDVLHASDVFILASDWEGNPLALMEAMAAAKPVICTNVGGVAEVVGDGKKGILIEKGDVENLGYWMEKLAQDEQLRKLLGRNARQHAVRSFSATAMTASYESLYTELASNKIHPLTEPTYLKRC